MKVNVTNDADSSRTSPASLRRNGARLQIVKSDSPSKRLVEALFQLLPNGDDPDEYREFLREHARRMHVHPDTLERWATGASRPDFDNAIAVLDAFGPEFEGLVRGRMREWTAMECFELAQMYNAVGMKKLRESQSEESNVSELRKTT